MVFRCLEFDAAASNRRLKFFVGDAGGVSTPSKNFGNDADGVLTSVKRFDADAVRCRRHRLPRFEAATPLKSMRHGHVR